MLNPTPSQRPTSTTRLRTRASRRRALSGVAALLALAGLTACEVDSFLYDQSVVGRWEHTPGSAPILEYLAAIEGPAGEKMETSKIRPEDLVPEPESYRLGPGDYLEITIQDLFNANMPEKFEIDVDPRGFIDIPQAPGIFVDGKTVEQTKDAIVKALKERGILENALVQVIVRGRRKLTYTITGAVERPGQYQINKPDLRLLEALPAAGQFPETTTQTIYVIRAIPLSDAASGRLPPPGQTAPERPTTPMTDPNGMTPPPAKPKEPIIDLIDELSGGKKEPKKDETAPTPPVPAPTPAPAPNPAILGALDRQPERRDPVIDIDDPAKAKPANGAAPGETNWAFVDGKWVQSTRRATPSSNDIITQRIIEIPVGPLMAGSYQYNIVIRPGDIIRVPASPQGLFYVSGQVARPGPYTLPTSGKVTLTKAIITAGNLNGLGVPEKVDLTRMVGPDRQATVRLNLRAIKELTQPDVFIRPDDVIDVGTNFWAFPMQVMRNGYRFSYGFGFIMDRNFGYDVFGAQRTNAL